MICVATRQRSRARLFAKEAEQERYRCAEGGTHADQRDPDRDWSGGSSYVSPPPSSRPGEGSLPRELLPHELLPRKLLHRNGSDPCEHRPAGTIPTTWPGWKSRRRWKGGLDRRLARRIEKSGQRRLDRLRLSPRCRPARHVQVERPAEIPILGVPRERSAVQPEIGPDSVKLCARRREAACRGGVRLGNRCICPTA